MTDSIQKLLKFANTVFVLGILFSILIVIYAVYRINDPYSEPYFIGYDRLGSSTFYYMSILFGGILATLFGLGLKLNDHLKMNLSALFVSTSIAVYGVETYLEFSHETRTRSEVLEDLVESGVKAYPTALPRFFIKLNGLNTADTLIYPLGGVLKITNIFTNESGFYPVIQTDEHGFNNPIGLYKKNKVDIVLTGDSFAEGYSVHPDETIGVVLLKSGFIIH